MDMNSTRIYQYTWTDFNISKSCIILSKRFIVEIWQKIIISSSNKSSSILNIFSNSLPFGLHYSYLLIFTSNEFESLEGMDM